jgi:hypothetical protein
MTTPTFYRRAQLHSLVKNPVLRTVEGAGRSSHLNNASQPFNINWEMLSTTAAAK